MPIEYRATSTGVFQSANELNEAGNAPTYGVLFNGTSSYLSIPNTNIGALSTNEWTVECFVNLNNYGTYWGAGSGYLCALFCTTDASAIGLQVVFVGTVSSWTQLSFYTTGGAINQKGNYAFQLNTWYHIAITRTNVNNGTYYMFVNGSLILSWATTSTWTDNNWNIGRSAATNQYYWFKGTISNFRVVLGTGAYLYTKNFTVPFSPLSNIANTKLLICQSSTFIDNASTPSTVTNNSATISGPLTITAANVAAKPSFSVTSAVATLDEFYGSQPSTYGVIFSGNNSYLSFPNTNIGALSSNEWTIECFVHLLNYPASTASALVGTWNTSSGMQYGISGTSTSFTGLFVYTSGGNINASVNYAFQLNTWYHITLSRTIDGTFYMFVDGKLIYSFTNAAGWSDNGFNIGRNLQVGAEYYLNGIISNLRITLGSGTALTAEFTPPMWPLTNIANTKLLTCQSSTIIDNASTPSSITNTNTTIYQHDNFTRISKTGVLYPAAYYDEVTALT